MEEINQIKIANALNLPTLNIKSQLNLNIDSNAYIKQVLNIETCLIEHQIETLSNKAVIKGTIGVKIVYMDTDNIFNTLSDTVNFSETINSDNISHNCIIDVNNSQFVSEFDNDDKTLRINIYGTIDCFCILNNDLKLFNQSEGLVCKKNVISANSCIQQVNKTLNYDFDFKLDWKINKLLSYNSQLVIDETSCHDGYILAKGEIINTFVYEIENNLNNIKIHTNSTPFKLEAEATNCDNDCMADLNAYINLNTTQITTDINENYTNFNIEYSIVATGFVYKNININVIEDLYSLDNFVEPTTNKYNLSQKLPQFKSYENVDTEITLADELNVDEILGMVNTSSTITQYAIKENTLIIEGVVNGTLLYLDETRTTKQLSTQLPYSISIKQELNGSMCGLRAHTIPISCKCKIKRGNTLIVDYELCIIGHCYIAQEIELIDNIKYGNPLNYGDIAFQIYLARQNETIWDLCKRLHTTQEKLTEFNNDLPSTFLGGEKIVVYR